MIHALLILGFIACAAEVAYTYVGYALLVWAASRLRGRLPTAEKGAELPRVTLLIAAYNEQAVIAQRLRNALATDYPADKLTILVGSDGSTDRTTDIVLDIAREPRPGPVIRLMKFSRRRGKASVLNDCVTEAIAGGAEMLAFSDANTFHDADAVRNLVRWFADPAIGAVCGRLVLTDPLTGQNVDGVYWKYETFLKKCESRLGALLGANGAIYALRPHCFVPIAPGTIVDDFVIPLLAKMRYGCGLVYDEHAIAREETAPDVAGEFRRRVRIGAGGFQSVGMLWSLMHPRRGWLAVAFLSHKVLRWVCPFALLGLLACNVALLHTMLFRYTLAAQLLFYLASAIGPWVRGSSSLTKPLRIATMFTGMNLALLFGFFHWLRRPATGTWQRTQRSEESGAAVSGSVA